MLSIPPNMGASSKFGVLSLFVLPEMEDVFGDSVIFSLDNSLSRFLPLLILLIATPAIKPNGDKQYIVNMEIQKTLLSIRKKLRACFLLFFILRIIMI